MNSNLKPVGYNELINRYKLEVLPPWCESWLAQRGERKTHIEANRTTEIYPPVYDPGSSLGDQLTFAFKYEGINLEILRALFKCIDTTELVNFISSQPTGKYSRLIWFFYEWLTGDKLSLPDISQGNYIDALDPNKYYVLDNELAENFKRQRVTCNLLGPVDYSPVIRKTKKIRDYEEMHLDMQARKTIEKYSPELIYRATQYLYAIETKSSFEIERENSDKRRSSRFIELLREARNNSITKNELISLQKQIVEERFALDDYRDFQNYVGQSIGPAREVIHYAAPKPEDIESLMAGWVTCAENILSSDFPPVVTAAIIGYGFVFLHPFDDGNGRLHRYLIHHVLAKKKFTSEGLIFPVSATMLKNITKYDESLEKFSRELMKFVEYSLDENGEMTVINETVNFYRYQDMTSQTESLFEFIQVTITDELNTELEYLEIFDKARSSIREIVDMPDRKLDLFIKLCLQNKGRFPKNKLDHFSMLTKKEISDMSKTVKHIIRSKE